MALASTSATAAARLGARQSPPPLRVWAPAAASAELQVGAARVPMEKQSGGWWVAPCAVAPGDDYGFILNGDGPFPDPRSPFQPNGVHALSRAVDHGAFEWSDARWQAPPLASAVMYELHVGTFSPEGTFDGAARRLDHLVALGVTHVELMPVCEFPGSHGWGYDGVDLYAPHHAYGGPDGLKRLVDACHQRGLAVILDVVYNHLGPAGNYVRRFGPYFTDHYKTPWGEGVNLDGAESDEVRRFFCDNALMWLTDYHFDGLRLDAVHALVDASATHFLEQLANEVTALEAATGRHLVLIAESDLNDPRIVRSQEAGGYGIGAQWSDDFHHALHSVLTRERSGYYEDFGRLAHLAAAIQQVFVYAGDYSAHRRRAHGRPPDGIPGWRFVVCAQNHDQVGNRAMGDRLSHLVSEDRLKIAAALLLTSPFVPLLFQGEEWGASSPFQYFTDHVDEELGAAVREGRRREFAAFGWDPLQIPDPQASATWERSKLAWNELARAPHRELLEWYRALIELRRSTPALRAGNYAAARIRFDEEAEWLVVRRGPVQLACNFAGREQNVPLDGSGRLLLASRLGIECRTGEATLPPESAAVVAMDRSGGAAGNG